jgi:molybdopterin-synthase adenylyltransferase
MDKKALEHEVIGAASVGIDPAGEKYSFISLTATMKLAGDHNLPGRIIELAALEANIIPERYHRNIGSIGVIGQAKLLQSAVGVVGAGGLGGSVLELLARMGVGRLVVVDDDTFTESNLNRQLLATVNNMGKPKTEAALKRIAEINSSLEAEVYKCRGNADNLPDLFSDCDLVIDCLDNLSSRFELEQSCQKLGITMIHGAIAGLLGQLAVIRPDRPLLQAIYGPPGEKRPDRGAEVQLGNPAATPTMLAAWQVSEAVKVLTGSDSVLPDDILLIIDMQSGETHRIRVAPNGSR